MWLYLLERANLLWNLGISHFTILFSNVLLCLPVSPITHTNGFVLSSIHCYNMSWTKGKLHLKTIADSTGQKTKVLSKLSVTDGLWFLLELLSHQKSESVPWKSSKDQNITQFEETTWAKHSSQWHRLLCHTLHCSGDQTKKKSLGQKMQMWKPEESHWKCL